MAPTATRRTAPVTKKGMKPPCKLEEKTDEETDATDRGKDGREREAFVRSRNSGLCSNEESVQALRP